ncbi:hypothetical protein EKO27_g9566 [Xylaria grammica]|uniref:lytic cellulose monooxygenase (C4-dehydrogenating) n=1 Tax=Xylaria grammica TaxID=363999 RepID=A0A439CTP8_9PEZI|nr:hypothetical protein EKO27_g9566 [Xylaria grammica]
MPPNNNPVTNVNSNDIRCNVGGTRGVGAKCAAKAGSTVTVEMHAQPGDRSCSSEAIGGAHYGPVNVYLSKVSDATTADGSTPWYKIFADSWSSKGSVGDGDNWGTNDLNTCCGKMDVVIPKDTPSGDYLLRAEVIALHTAGQSGGAQFYMSCYQLTVTGGSGSAPAGVSLPGAFKASDPGIQVNIHAKMDKYVNPGPDVIAGGVTKTAGSGCSAGCAKTCTAGSGPVGTAIAAPAPTSGSGSGSGGNSGCAQAAYQQCGGQGWTGCTACARPPSSQPRSPQWRRPRPQDAHQHPARWAHKLPEALSLEHGALIEPLSVAMHARARAGLEGGKGEGSTVLILGAGAVGLLCGAVAKVAGAKTIVIADILPERTDFAVDNGFAHAKFTVPIARPQTIEEKLAYAQDLAEKIKEVQVGGESVGEVDITFECTGVESCMHTAIYSTKPGGKVMIIGMGTPIQTIPISAASLKEVDLVGVFRYANTYPAAIELLAGKNERLPDVSKLVTQRFQGLSNIPAAFDMAGKAKDEQGNLVLKVMVDTSDEARSQSRL